MSADGQPGHGRQSHLGVVNPRRARIGRAALVHHDENLIGVDAAARAKRQSQDGGAVGDARVKQQYPGSVRRIGRTVKDTHIVWNAKKIIVHGQDSGRHLSQVQHLHILKLAAVGGRVEIQNHGRRHGHGIDRTRDDVAGVECRVQRTVTVQAGDMIGRGVVIGGELAADQYLAIGLRQDAPDHAVRAHAGHKGGVQRAVGVHAGHAVALNAVIG